MMDKRLVLKTAGAAIAVGIMIGASPSILAAAADLKRGLLGEAPTGVQLSAQAATPVLQRPLAAEDQQELMQGLLYMVKGQSGAAAHLLGKYAMLGEPNAQMQIGAMYYFGKGLPLDRDEGIRWLRLSAAQGSSYGREALSAAMSGTWAWNTPPQHDSENPDEFRTIVARYARANGGISIREYAALARTYSAAHGQELPDGSGDEMASAEPLRPYADRGAPGADHDRQRYRGSSGATYQYDLSNPADRIRYQVDPSAQIRDSVDPRVRLDRNMGQYGGGVEHR